MCRTPPCAHHAVSLRPTDRLPQKFEKKNSIARPAPFFPPEIVTPPLPLVALLGPPAAVDAVTHHLRSGRRPPLTSAVAPDAASLGRLFPPPKPAPADPDAVAGTALAWRLTPVVAGEDVAGALAVEREVQ